MDTREQTKQSWTKSSLLRAVIGVVCFYFFLLLLNGEGIYNGLSKMEYGETRDFWMRVVTPLRDVSVKARTTVVREWIEVSAGAWLNEF